MFIASPFMGAASDAGGFAVLMLVPTLSLLALLFEKAVATNVSAAGFRRLSDCVDVGVIPLGIGWLVIVATQLAQPLGQGS